MKRKLDFRNIKKIWYHSSDKKLPAKLTVKKNSSLRTLRTLEDDYGYKDLPYGLFVSDSPELTKPYGKYLYEVKSFNEPMMIDNGKYIFSVGLIVEVRLKD
jgi:hypothetical protein